MKNYFIIEGDITKVYSNGKHKEKIFTIDTCNLNLIGNYSWRINCHINYKKVESTVCVNGKSKHIILARYLLNAPPDKYVDHKNCDPLDNRMENLRFANCFQNSQNAPKTFSKRSSQYKGISWHRNKNKWIVSIQCNNTKYHLGYFKDESEAARAYDKKAKELFSEFAKLNFP